MRVTDPVCGMQVDTETAAARVSHEGREYVFCCAGCREKFVREPEKYLASDEKATDPVCGMTVDPATPCGARLPFELLANHADGSTDSTFDIVVGRSGFDLDSTDTPPRRSCLGTGGRYDALVRRGFSGSEAKWATEGLRSKTSA